MMIPILLCRLSLVLVSKVFEFFNSKVTKANSYQTEEVFAVSQELLSVLDGEFVLSAVDVRKTKMNGERRGNVEGSGKGKQK